MYNANTKDRKSTDYIAIHCSATSEKLDIGAKEIDKWHRGKGPVSDIITLFDVMVPLRKGAASLKSEHMCRAITKTRLASAWSVVWTQTT